MEDRPQGSFEDLVLLLVLCVRPSPKKAEQETPWLGRGDKEQDSLGSHLSPSPEHELPEGRNSSQCYLMHFLIPRGRELAIAQG